MNGGTPVRDGEGHSVSLKEYIERIFDEREKALNVALRSQEERVREASKQVDMRLDKLNELRAEVQADRSEFVKKGAYESEYASLSDKVSILTQTQIKNENKYVTVEKYKTEIEPLKDLRGKITSIIAGSVAIAAVVGYAISAVFGGGN